ncbi:NADH-quinone oxidoreductase subunit G [Mycobacterium alsense]|uniref:NADH-quinone oxidoreductase n=1 Tax=Mycobacterium alsense TaxID=324058 RepID=A0AA41XPX1_9MYCO|nr:NADH-quinone oxidoreductase subunit G [Mycobacterium alsense]MCV7379277.1 NADH-quinone oxidoreductase subunit G [Mycobacterium alsense]OQZ92408.1 NADH-quinone oxidoreductase subunit G [Mycobacterium alsense]
MTQAAKPETGDGVAQPEMVTFTIDDNEVTVPKGTLVIRAAELLGIQIPRFCEHPLLDPVGACRQCIVEIEGQRKPMTSCTVVATDDMVVRTQLTSEVADKAQHLVMELLLINHPLDCPMCDKGGECPLQNQAMSNGRPESRFHDDKRRFAKPINVSSQVLLDRERCISCVRCTRFSEQIAGDKFIDVLERGAQQQIGIYANEPFNSYFSGNTVQICPVGALTGTAYRFRARPFDLVSSPSVCEHCASGCAQRTDHRRGKVLRRLAGDDPEVNEEWNCDKGRWAFTYATQPDVITTPLIRDAAGELQPASWSHAIATAAQGLEGARGRAGVLVGGRVTWEDAYAYSKFARITLDTNDIDFRARPHSAEEADFLAARIAGQPVTVSYSDLESAPVVVLVGFEPEEESPIVFLRLRKAARKNGVPVYAVAPFATRALEKMSGRLLETVPGAEAAALDGLAGGEVGELLAKPGAVIMAGERLATVPGGFSAAARLADATGARLAWVPRRAGERGALEAGALPTLLPGGRPVGDDAARAQVATAWNVDELPSATGRDTDAILAAATDGSLGALLVGGIEPGDFADPDAVLAALDAVGFLVSLELRHSPVTERADVVFPVAATTQKSGAFVNWEGRYRGFEPALRGTAEAARQSDHRVLDTLADEMGVYLGTTTVESARDELAALGVWDGERAAGPEVAPAEPPRPGRGQAVLAGWRMLLDEGRMQDGEPHLAGTARKPVVRLSADTAAEIGATDGADVTVGTPRGSITLPLAITDMPDRVVWLPLNSPGSAVHRKFGVTVGGVVTIGAGA